MLAIFHNLSSRLRGLCLLECSEQSLVEEPRGITTHTLHITAVGSLRVARAIPSSVGATHPRLVKWVVLSVQIQERHGLIALVTGGVRVVKMHTVGVVGHRC